MVQKSYTFQCSVCGHEFEDSAVYARCSECGAGVEAAGWVEREPFLGKATPVAARYTFTCPGCGYEFESTKQHQTCPGCGEYACVGEPIEYPKAPDSTEE